MMARHYDMPVRFYGVGVAEVMEDRLDALRYAVMDYSISKRPTHDGFGRPILWPKEKNMKKLFWVAVLYHGGKNRKKTEVVQFPEVNLFANEDAAREKTIAGIPANYKKRYDRLEVVVRPF